ncbi:hypothetical protein BD311DRAFT_219124 [Dichomitus squalens]|uniref:Uncharacterized protein n=1 Tax=Dichomitus squalens TaxID=114155 RepID=A0A4Q9MRS1_9APHY|nr:hypothetical protein BD311DRAFT_219124 [Dichomitus squalens]
MHANVILSSSQVFLPHLGSWIATTESQSWQHPGSDFAESASQCRFAVECFACCYIYRVDPRCRQDFTFNSRIPYLDVAFACTREPNAALRQLSNDQG